MPKRKLQEDEMKRRLAEDDTDGHMKRRLDNDDEMKRRLAEDDTDGHMKRRLDNEMKRRADDEDDTEGHRLIGRSLDQDDEVKYT
jgi:hypothetical protein